MPRLPVAMGLISAILLAACSSAGASTAPTAPTNPPSTPPSAAMSEAPSASPSAAAVSSEAPSAAAVSSEAPSAAASAGAMQVVAKGDLKPIDGTAKGVVQLVALPDGMYEVVLEGFSIGAIAHTNVVLVSNASVTKTDDIDKTKLLDLGPLKGTEGMQTYAVPAAMAATVMGGYHTVVIWDTQMAHAIAAASLQ